MWRTVPNFKNYEYNANGVIRNKKTKQVCSRVPVSFTEYGYTLIGEDGKSHKIKESVLFNKQVDDEEWFPVKGFEKYEITKSGKVRNAQTKNVLSPTGTSWGYMALSLRGNDGKTHRAMVHRLVATQFLENPNNLPIVNHIDEDKTNNALSNLEWVSDKENSNHGTRSDRIKHYRMKPINEYDKNGKYIRTWNCAKSITECYKTGDSEIRHSIKTKSFCKGHIFRDYEGSAKDLTKSQLPKKKRAPRDYEITKMSVPEKYLFVEVQESVEDIFKKYRAASTITNAQRLKDFKKVFDYIDKLEESIDNG